MACLTDHVTLGLSLDMAGKAVTAKSIHHVHEPPGVNCASLGTDIKFDKLPVFCGRAEPRFVFHHDLSGNQLDYRARGIGAGAGRGNRHGFFNVAL